MRWHPRLGRAFSRRLPPPTHPLPMVLPHSLLHSCHCNNRRSPPYPTCWACWHTRQQHPLDLGQGHEGLPEPSRGGIPGSPEPCHGGVKAWASPLAAASRLGQDLLRRHPRPAQAWASLLQRHRGSGEPSRGGVPGKPLVAALRLGRALSWQCPRPAQAWASLLRQRQGSGEPSCGGVEA